MTAEEQATMLERSRCLRLSTSSSFESFTHVVNNSNASNSNDACSSTAHQS